MKLTILYVNDCSYAKIKLEPGWIGGFIRHEIDEHLTAGIQVNPVRNGTAGGIK